MAEEPTTGKPDPSPKLSGLSIDKYRRSGHEQPVVEKDEKVHETAESRLQARRLAQQAQPKLTREQLQANQRHEREVFERNKYVQSQNFGYLDVFEREKQERNQAVQEFKREDRQRQAQIESLKPAFFQKDASEKQKKQLTWREVEHEAYKNLQKSTEMNFDPEKKTHEELREFFKIANDKNAVKDMHEKMFESTTARMKTRSNEFYAFLNKQFNIMNFKSARCSMHCFSSVAKPLTEVGVCLSTCRTGITDCRDYVHNLQKETQQKLTTCVQEAADQRNLTDPIVHFMSCYEQTIKRFDTMQEQIEDEFSNFV